VLSDGQWRSIHAFQERELLAILKDANHARRVAHTTHWTKIGDWLGSDRPGSVLELGCGPGRYVALLAQLGHRVVGVDPVSYPTWPLIQMHLAVDLRSGIKAEELPFPDAHFDHVACLGALLYFPDDKQALREIRRVLKPGGRLIVRTVNSNNFYTAVTGRKLDPASHNLYAEDELRSLLETEGFKVANSFTYGFWPPFATDYWWYLMNTEGGRALQSLLSALTPRGKRVNLNMFATRGSSIHA
jgi:ubiquinone/menaquinone biosynthesis C-methylase UbiE